MTSAVFEKAKPMRVIRSVVGGVTIQGGKRSLWQWAQRGGPGPRQREPAGRPKEGAGPERSWHSSDPAWLEQSSRGQGMGPWGHDTERSIFESDHGNLAIAKGPYIHSHGRKHPDICTADLQVGFWSPTHLNMDPHLGQENRLETTLVCLGFNHLACKTGIFLGTKWI